MIKGLKHLPKEKQEELQIITKSLEACKGVEMVILFGSYARGTWVEDLYEEKGTTYEYQSDYDILVVTNKLDIFHQFDIEKKMRRAISGQTETPISLIFHSIKHLNQALDRGNYFFTDIKKEGILLFNSQKFDLREPKILTSEEAKQKAQEYYNQWFTSACEFIEGFEFYYGRNLYHKSAFLLHQSVEHFYVAILLVFTDYRPKEHDLQKLDLKVRNCDKRFHIFSRKTKEEKHLFRLLQRAYIDARYKIDEYSITKEELEYLANKVYMLKEITVEICKQRILKIGSLD